MKSIKFFLSFILTVCLTGCSSFIDDLVKLADKGTPYTVVHHFEKADLFLEADGAVDVENPDHWDEELDVKETLYGEPETETKAVAKVIPGFTSLEFAQDIIAADGTTEINIYYTRNKVSVTFDIGTGMWNYVEWKTDKERIIPDTNPRTVNGKFGNKIPYSHSSSEIDKENSGMLSNVFDGVTAGNEKFDMWPDTYPAADTTYVVQWAEKDSVNYTVKHWFENVDASSTEENETNYTVDASLTQTLSGKPDTLTEAVAKEIPGFTASEFAQKEIMGNGSTEIDIYYTRNTITVTLSCGEGTWNYTVKKQDSTVSEDKADKTFTGKFGHTIDYSSLDFGQAGKKSCVLEKWNDGENDFAKLENLSPVKAYPAKDVTYTAIWKEMDSVEYKVQHWFENADSQDSSDLNNYTSDEKKAVTLHGKPEYLTDAKALDANVTAGFTVKAFSQEEINADGSTVVDIYYTRNIYELTFNTADGLWNYDSYRADTHTVTPDSEAKSLSGKYGATVDYSKLNNFETLKKRGMDLDGWYMGENKSVIIKNDRLPKTFPLENTIYTAAWTDKAVVGYKVNHMIEKLDSTDAAEPSNYTLHSSETTKKGIPEHLTEAVAKTITGFTPREIVQEEINADGSTEVNVYYERNEVTVTFDPNTGYWDYMNGIKSNSRSITVTGKYDAELDLSVLPMETLGKTAHDFQGWTKDDDTVVISTEALPAKIPAENVTYHVSWKQGAGVKYYIRHYQQNITDDEYTLFETTEGIGTKETETEAVAKEYAGFISREFSQKTIGTTDYDTEVVIKYDRNMITFTFDANGGTGGTTVTKRYETPFDSSWAPVVTKPGYTFGGWTTYGGTVDEKFMADKTFTAYWASTVQIGDLTHTTDIEISATTTPDSTTCTVTVPSGYENDTWSYKWFVDGVNQDNADDKTFTRTKAQLGIGVHTITVQAKANGTVYTKQYTATFE